MKRDFLQDCYDLGGLIAQKLGTEERKSKSYKLPKEITPWTALRKLVYKVRT
jgi:hypothetical protein